MPTGDKSSVQGAHILGEGDAGATWSILPPVDAYDIFAKHYGSHSQFRSAYLGAIEDIVMARAGNARSVLDAGAGDGLRSRRIAAGVGAERLVLMEPSAGMRALCPEAA